MRIFLAPFPLAHTERYRERKYRRISLPFNVAYVSISLNVLYVIYTNMYCRSIRWNRSPHYVLCVQLYMVLLHMRASECSLFNHIPRCWFDFVSVISQINGSITFEIIFVSIKCVQGACCAIWMLDGTVQQQTFTVIHDPIGSIQNQNSR